VPEGRKKKKKGGLKQRGEKYNNSLDGDFEIQKGSGFPYRDTRGEIDNRQHGMGMV